MNTINKVHFIFFHGVIMVVVSKVGMYQMMDQMYDVEVHGLTLRC